MKDEDSLELEEMLINLTDDTVDGNVPLCPSCKRKRLWHKGNIVGCWDCNIDSSVTSIEEFLSRT